MKRQAQPMSSALRALNYLKQNGSGEGPDVMSALTPRQRRRWRKKHNRALKRQKAQA